MGYLDGFAVTFRKLFHGGEDGRVVTVEYPKKKRAKAIRFHGRHVLNRYANAVHVRRHTADQPAEFGFVEKRHRHAQSPG